MLNVSDKTKEIYLNENMPKYITISFPNGDHADITNSNILEESMKLVQSICEENKPIVGGCNSSQFEITVADIDEDLTNKMIKVTISLKDPHYRGFFGDLSKEYNEGDVVKSVSGEYYECIKQTYEIQSLEFSTQDIPNVGKLKTAILNNITEYGVLKVNTGSIDWSNLQMNIIQAKSDGTSPDVTTITNDFNSIIMINSKCTSITISIQDKSSDGSALDILIQKLDVRLLVSSGRDEEHWQQSYGYIDTSDTDDIVLFDGQIESCKKKNDRRFRDIVAYDYLHYLDENSNIIISDFFKSGDYGLVDSHNKGEWVQGKLYKKGDVIHCDYTIPQGGSSYLDMSAWYEYLQPVNKGQSKWNPYELYTGYFDNQYNIKGSEILKKLTKNKKATTTVKKIRDKLFEYLGEVFDFKQQETTLPMDNVTLWIKPFSSNMTLMQLLDYICNLNGVFGFYNPHTAQFEYVAPPDVSTPYNIGRNYDMDGAEYSDNVFECKSFDIIDSNGNSLQGTADKPSMSVKYSFLLKDQYTPADCISIVNSSMLGQNKLKFTPTKLKMMGLPFITPGDVISYKVDEYSPDEDGILVDTEKTITTVVLKRTLSGIVALTDDIEANYEE